MVNQRYVVNEREAYAVREAFHGCLQGKSMRERRDVFVRLGIRSKRSNTPSGTSIHEILRNRKYTGVDTFAEVRKNNHRDNQSLEQVIMVHGAIPQIIDPAVWEEVQQAMNRNKQAGNRGKNSRIVNLVSGIVFSGTATAPCVSIRAATRAAPTATIAASAAAASASVPKMWMRFCLTMSNAPLLHHPSRMHLPSISMSMQKRQSHTWAQSAK